MSQVSATSQVAKVESGQTTRAASTDGLNLSPAAKAVRSAQVYAETASANDMPVADKLAIFKQRFGDNAEFQGPLFGHLTGRQVFGKLSFEHSSGADIRYKPVSKNDTRQMTNAEIAKIDPRAAAAAETWHEAKLDWVADYELGGNKIRNEVTTKLAIDGDGQIRRHEDSFDWKKWMDQAVPAVPKFIRHSRPFKKLANLALGVFTFFKG